MNQPLTEQKDKFIDSNHRLIKYWYVDLLLILILMAGGYLRYVGISWDENQHLHPDERFLTDTESLLMPVHSIAEYFNTDQSTLNPHNVGKSFYVYGDFPIVFTRYMSDWIGQSVDGRAQYDGVNVLGRELSAAVDLLTLLMVFLIGKKMYDRRVGLLAAMFYSLAVTPIQLSHFFAVDTYACFFVSVAVYAAACIYQSYREADQKMADGEDIKDNTWRALGYYILFGVGLGMAMSSKVSTAPLAIVLPAAVIGWYLRLSEERQVRWFLPLIRNMAIAAAVAFLFFRVFQPYAFAGPSFFNLKLDPKWVSNMQEVRGQSNGDADFPPALQWARRPKTFALTNLTLWGTGLPLGILGWAALVFMTYKLFKKEWPLHLPIWLWTVVYFGYQSISFNPMMRYTFLIYPTFCLIAAWLIFKLWDYRRQKDADLEPTAPAWSRILAVGLAVTAVVGSGLWAFAFTRIYTRPVTRIEASRWIYQNVPGAVNLHLDTDQGGYTQPVPFPQNSFIMPSNSVGFDFNAKVEGNLKSIHIYRMGDQSGNTGAKTITVSLIDVENNTHLAEMQLDSDFTPGADKRGNEYTIDLKTPIHLLKGHRYHLLFELTKGDGMITVQGTAIASETDWDDGLPLRIDDYDGYSGIYTGDLNFQMYWDDNEDKRTRFISTLDGADYIFITSNRQWGTTTRVPERYPMSTAFYRALIGCPQGQDILKCYAYGQPGMYSGSLGYDLVKVFESDPNIGSFKINDQLAEESFTVYDHPKVLIFKKSASYSSEKVAAFFNGMDISHIIHVPLNQVPSHVQDLMLSSSSAALQQSGGTWSELYHRDALYNKYPALAVVLWYVVLGLLGLVMQPFVRLALPGLRDRGYAFGRIAGMLILALLVWLAASVGIPFSRLTISAVAGLLLIGNLVLAWFQKDELKDFFKSQKKHILITELVILAFFLLDLGIRIGNPDLWHPYKGGEKPMDFSYFNAILKSTTFPPYDPWFSGGYINYYYYGFVLVGVLVKWLGIIPSIAYNIILPTLFSLLAIGAFCIIYNVITAHRETREPNPTAFSPYWIAIAAAIGLAVLGNLGTVRMIWYGLMKLVVPIETIRAAGSTFFEKIGWTVQGLVKFFQGQALPYSPGDWYWIPSRAIPSPNDVEPITEFPFFTFLYADLHAHMIALPVTGMVLGWVTSVMLGKGRWGTEKGRLFLVSLAASLFLGATAVGALRPTNTWDFPVYFVLCLLALIYVFFRYKDSFMESLQRDAWWNNHWIRGILVLAVFAGLALFLYYPYTYWYGAGYNSAELWKGDRTPSWSYLTHWGVFLFFIVCWMIQETIAWMAATPLKKLAYLRPYAGWIYAALGLLVVATIGLVVYGVAIAWFVLPLAFWALVLLLRPDQSDIKRLFLFFIGTGLFLTLIVEIIVLVGDIGRMNTVFKFYLQVWSMFALTAAAGAYWMFEDIGRWPKWVSSFVQAVGFILVLCAALFSITGAADKIRDRYVSTASHSLDGTNYMLGATFLETDVNTNGSKDLQLEQDYHAIRWMQDNVKGSPVIVEGSVVEYRWGARYTINTGLPAVIGWNWHQRQQRAVIENSIVTKRVEEVNNFYATENMDDTLAFLKKYNVKYIVVGQMEEAIYPLSRLQKFKAYSGTYWNPVYTYKDTTIYEVLPGAGS
jgi:YYY domain-containing protein